MHITFTKNTACEFPATTFKKGKTYSVPDALAERFIEDGSAERVDSPVVKSKNQALTEPPAED